MSKYISISIINGKVIFTSNFFNSYNIDEIQNIFHRNYINDRFISTNKEELIFKGFVSSYEVEKIKKILYEYCKKNNFDFIETQSYKYWLEKNSVSFEFVSKLGNKIKNSNYNDLILDDDFKEHVQIIKKNFNRNLSEEQLKNSYFAFKMKSSCNFSVPGAGKTTTILASFIHLKEKGFIDKLLVIGPKSSLKSWKDEYFYCFQKHPNIFLSKYTNDSIIVDYMKNNNINNFFIFNNYDIFFFNYDTLINNVNFLINFVDSKTLIVFDESHKIKNPFGKWSNICMKFSRNTIYKVLLTGTPIPNGYDDIFTTLKILHSFDYEKLWNYSVNDLKKISYSEIISFKKKFNPFFVRVSKKDLKIKEPNEDNIIYYELSDNEKEVYKIVKKIYRNNGFALYIKLLQSLINPKNILSNKLDIDEYLEDENNNFEKVIDNINIDSKTHNKLMFLLETIDFSTKIKEAIKLIKKILENGRNIIVWSLFINPMYLLKEKIDLFSNSEIINGSIDIEKREEIIDKFQNGKLKVLITNPQTLAESVSLHKCCHDAIYLDYSYNLVHMLQSRDRIHRFGLDVNVSTNYYYFIAKDNIEIESLIYRKLKDKEIKMAEIINSNEIQIENNDKSWVYDVIKEVNFDE